MNRNFTLEYKNPLLEGDCVRVQRHLEENAVHVIAIFLVHMAFCPAVILGNAAILLTIWKTSSLHTPAYMLLANLAVSDFATGLLMQPFVITIVLSASFGVSPSTFRFLCAGFGALACVLVGVSVLTITAIALDRLLALRLHLRYSIIVTKFRVNVVITTIWLLHNFNLNNICLRQQIHFQANAFRAIAVFLVSIPLCVMTLLGNAAILITIFKTPSLHSPAHILLAGLALSDFAFGFIVQPLLLSIVLSAGYNHDLPLATFHLMCSSLNCSAIVLCGVSLGTSIAIALDRLLALRLHLR
ncbi:unnamed protein product, partial [Porites lobata]